ncbi:uncharacterized protein LOC120197113 [Hibiscus syriacus]|uniref:uncharacterized protein LOC120197113 n=1 Tax=Hibiscus syriacus TaxID=106335 RepID=UPI001924BE37|nr:uncharacterized protein LOC120197113 [Hibiscus syriacus]
MEMKNEREMKHEFHEHPLVFVEEQNSEADPKAYCYGCCEMVSGPCFSCAVCNYHLHQKCAEAPLSISNHPLHPKHPGFFLRKRPYPDSKYVYGCALCKEKRNMFFYECRHCWFSLDIKCFNLSSSYNKVNPESKHDFHQHPLTFIQTPMDEHKRSYCSCCHQPLLDALYVCVDCPFIIHKKCLDELSTIIHHPSHRQHPLSLESIENAHFCKLCQTQHSGYFYSCSLCNFNINIECAWARSVVEDKSHHQHAFTLFWRQDNSNLYDVIEQECQCEGLNAATQSSITRVIEVNEDGDATKIEHFIHEGHCLVLADKMEEKTDRKCDGCMLPVSTNLFYHCSESDCHFCLHKHCSELPRIKPLWLHRSNATLQSRDFLFCDMCNRPCSGFFYKIKGYYDVCLRCAKVPDIIESQAHQHFLFFDFKCKKKPCNGCGNDWHRNGAFRCGKCSFALDFRCVTLPHSTRHKSDEHILYLNSHDDNDYPNHCYCDICEEKRNPSLQYYHCPKCDTSAHVNCVLGKFSFLKDGTRLSDYYINPHDHDLIFLQKIEGYPECSHCEQQGGEDALGDEFGIWASQYKNGLLEALGAIAGFQWNSFGILDATVATTLVGNKCDLETIRDVSVEDGKSLAEAQGLFFM